MAARDAGDTCDANNHNKYNHMHQAYRRGVVDLTLEYLWPKGRRRA